MLAGTQSMGSPLQKHRVLAATDLQWVSGTMETLGGPHNYINQDDLDFFTVHEARITPWTFTGLPSSHAERIVLVRSNLQLLIFPEEQALQQFRAAPRTDTLILNLPLAIVRGEAPFLSEAQLGNFLDFWKGLFFPVVDARIHYLASGTAELPSQAQVLYVNRRSVQSYVHA